MKKSVLQSAILVSLFIFGSFFSLHAQVTIGDNTPPNAFSALELISGSTPRGMRLPQFTAAERTALEAVIAGDGQARGLMIFNMDTDCVETWNGEEWIAACVPTICRAKTSATTWLTFKCHNLGADTDADPFTPSPSIHGAKYRFGAKDLSYTQTQDQTNWSSIADWNLTWHASYPFQDDGNNWSTANNPCPSGWRLPTSAEWSQIINPANNDLEYTTPSSLWDIGPHGNAGNYNVGLTIVNGSNRVFFPAAGSRQNILGFLLGRGSNGYYWSNTANGGDGDYMSFNSNSTWIATSGREHGYSVRCVQ